MSPIITFKKLFQKFRSRSHRAEIGAFIAEVDIRVRVFGLDPCLPEILALKSQASEILSSYMGSGMARVYLTWLNPYKDCTHEGLRLVVHERMLGHVLNPWTLVEFHLGKGKVESICWRIRVDEDGTHIYGESGREFVLYKAGILNPGRLADPGNRVNNAALLINYITGLSLTRDELWPMYWAEITRGDGGRWNVELGREQSVKV